MSNSRRLEKTDEMGWTSFAEELGAEPRGLQGKRIQVIATRILLILYIQLHIHIYTYNDKNDNNTNINNNNNNNNDSDYGRNTFTWLL